jgi:hypothetical protein
MQFSASEGYDWFIMNKLQEHDGLTSSKVIDCMQLEGLDLPLPLLCSDPLQLATVGEAWSRYLK